MQQFEQSIKYLSVQKNETIDIDHLSLNKSNIKSQLENEYQQNLSVQCQNYKEVGQGLQRILRNESEMHELTINKKLRYQKPNINIGDLSHKILTKQEQENEELNLKDGIEQQLSQQQDQYKLCTLYKNELSIVELIFKPNLRTFIIVKQNLIEYDQFKKEYQILQRLKDKNLTLDIISKSNNNSQFTQIAGKTNLQILKGKTNCNHLFELYFLILYDKLNKMHDLGVAHSDIKPQNIVISYDNEPFFIDFGGSVLLEDYPDYLTYFSPNFNLEVYVQNRFKPYYIKDFNNSEEVKLCDQTQLALTFLNLLCNDVNLLKQYSNKDFNQILQNLHKNSNSSRSIVLSIISRILNKADPQIKTVGDEIQQQFIIDHSLISKELQYSNDILFQEDKNKYYVNRIDEFNKQCFNIDIIPEKMIIIPQSDTKEYQFIYQKYNQIKQYYDRLIRKNHSLSKQDFFNLCEYLYIIQKGRCLIYIDNLVNCQILFGIIKLSKKRENLEFTFTFNLNFFYTFIKELENHLPFLYIQDIQFFGERIECETKKDINQLLNKQDIQLSMIFFEEIYYDDEYQYFKYIKNNYKIKQINLLFHYTSYNEQINSFEQQMPIIQQLMDLDTEYKLFIQFNDKIIIDKDVLYSQQTFCNIKNQYLNQQQLTKNEYTNTFQKIYEDIQMLNDEQSSNKNIFFLENQILIDIKKYVCQYQVECKICSTLYSIQTISKIPFKIIIKFYNFIFQNVDIWLELNKIIQNNQIEIIIINGQFSDNVIAYLNQIPQKYLVSYQFLDEFKQKEQINKYKYNEQINKNKLNYTMSVRYNQKYSNQNGLKVLFYSRFSTTINQNDSNEQSLNQSPTNHYQIHFLKQCQQEQDYHQQQEYHNKQEHDQNELKILESILGQHQIYRSSIQKEININDVQQQNILKIKEKNKQTNLVQDIDSLDQIIQEIENKIHYKEIKIKIKQNSFIYGDDDYEDAFEDQCYIKMKYICESSDKNNLMNKFYELYLTIVNNYEFLNDMNNFKQEIIQIKNYASYNIQQCLMSRIPPQAPKGKQLKQKDDIFNYYEEDEQVLIILKYSLIKQENGHEENQIEYSDQIRKEILNNQFIDNLKSFQKQYCFTNSLISSINFENKDYIAEFQFQNINIGNDAFKILFSNIQQMFPQKQKQYNLQECNLSVKSLYNIKEILKINKEEQIIKFNLLNNNISYFDFKQFIKQLILDHNIHYFIFEILISDYRIRELIENEFKDIFEIKEIHKFNHILDKEFDRFLLIEYKQQQNKLQIPNSKFKIVFNFDLTQFDATFLSNIFGIESDNNYEQESSTDDLQNFMQVLDINHYMRQEETLCNNDKKVSQQICDDTELNDIEEQQQLYEEISPNIMNDIFESLFTNKKDRRNKEFEKEYKEIITKICNEVDNCIYLPILNSQLKNVNDIQAILKQKQ